jgi:alginate O-acetyltransferase complex protein AlgI
VSFASPIFLWYFMPVVLVALWVAPLAARNWVVVTASLVFYAWGAGEFVFVLLGCVVVNFAAGLLIGAAASDERRRKLVLVAAIVFDLGVLVVWKYGSFGLNQAADAANAFGADLGTVTAIALPIGISFFTFHNISYVVDVYRGERPPQARFLDFLTYIVMFPQLVAGPIVRYKEIDDQLTAARERDRLDDFVAGFPRFALGLLKKVAIADSIAPVVDGVFGLPASQMNTTTVWLGAFAFSLQLYFDFSGYSDMAIGLGRMIGFRLPENFARPYSAVSMTDFWKRWHMSLSRWFRDYLYVPLGGNRGTVSRTYANLFIVFLLTGFWHGANWTFLAWGAYNGVILATERATGLRNLPDERLQALRRAVTFTLVTLGLVLFRAPDIGQAGDLLRVALLSFDFGPVPADVAVALTQQATLALAVGALALLLPRGFVTGRFLDRATTRPALGARLAVSSAGALAAGILVAAGSFSPFLYYQF